MSKQKKKGIYIESVRGGREVLKIAPLPAKPAPSNPTPTPPATSSPVHPRIKSNVVASKKSQE